MIKANVNSIKTIIYVKKIQKKLLKCIKTFKINIIYYINIIKCVSEEVDFYSKFGDLQAYSRQMT